jgi:hypothetical protein
METIGGEFAGGGYVGGASVAGTTPGQEAVNEDIPCRKCGYNLRGLGTGGLCPECGTLIWLSLRGTLLRYSDPDWLETIRRGFARMIAGITIVVAAVIVGAILGALRSFQIIMLAQLVAVVGWVLYMWGTWLITERDPSGLGEDLYGTSRKIIRIGVVCQAVGQVLEFLNVDRLPPMTATLLQAIGILIGIMFVVALFAQLQYLQKLSPRIPDIALSQRAHFLKRAIVTCYAVTMLGTIAALVFRGGAMMVVFGAVMALAGLALLIFALMYVRLLGRLKQSFEMQAMVARAMWAASSNFTPPPPPPAPAATA